LVKLEDALEKVNPRWRDQYLHFIETGEAEGDFLDYLNHDKAGQEAVEMAFNAQAEAFHGLAQELKTSQFQAKSPVEPAVTAADRMVEAVEGVVQLPLEQRTEAMRKTASALETSLAPEDQLAAHSVVQTLQNALRTVTSHH
jgi:hypothetical protein